MKVCSIILSTMSEIQVFVNLMSKWNCKCFLIHNEYKIDAKSLLGVLSLDLSNQLVLEIDKNDDIIKEQIILELQVNKMQITLL